MRRLRATTRCSSAGARFFSAVMKSASTAGKPTSSSWKPDMSSAPAITLRHSSPQDRRPPARAAVSWYAERDGFWAMSPGYDRPAHQDFRRLINTDCMACHNGYPRGSVEDAGNGPRFTASLPQGIDCQRCHGPGQAHIEAIKAGNIDAGRLAIANTASFDRDRQLETCMQCHLEPTSSPLPFQIRRNEQAPFSYRLARRSAITSCISITRPERGATTSSRSRAAHIACASRRDFQQSEMTCVTCHDPHDIPRGEKAVEQYAAVCAGCHEGEHRAARRAWRAPAACDVRRLPHAQAAIGRCRAHGDDGSLHPAPAAGAGFAGAAKRIGQLRAGRVSRRSCQLLSSGRRRRPTTSCIWR